MAVVWKRILTEDDLSSAIPDQSGHSGEFLTTDGSDPSWAEVSGVTDNVARDNIVLLAWKLAIAEGLSVFNLEDGVVDEFEDETGIDTDTSTNESYNSTDDYYSPAAVVDYMEYASDALAQAAYVTNGSTEYGGTIGSLGSSAGGNNTCINNNAAYLIGKTGTVYSVKYYTTTASVNIKFKIFRINGSNYDLVGESETFASVAGGATRTLTTPIPGVQANDIVGFYLASALSNVYVNAGKSGGKFIATDITTSTAIASWTNDAYAEFAISAIVTNLQSLSEATIKTQGSYSLKVVASTSAINKTLTRTIGSPIDLTGVDTLRFDIYSSRTGSNIKIGIHDSGGTTTEVTPNITDSNTWQEVAIDLSGVADANKDAIDSIIITIVNADSANTFYMDKFSRPLGNMALISESVEAETEPTTGRFLALIEPVDSITVNTDLKGYISNDDGSNFDEVTLTDEGYFDSTKKILSGNVTLTDRSDKTMVQKIQTFNSKDLKVHAWGMLWK